MRLQLLTRRGVRILRKRSVDARRRRRWSLAEEALQNENPSASWGAAVGLGLGRDHAGLAQDTRAPAAWRELNLGKPRRGRLNAVERSERCIHERLVAVEERPHVGCGSQHDVLEEKLGALHHG